MDSTVMRFAAFLGLPARKASAAKPKAANSNKAPRSVAPKPRPAATPAKRPTAATSFRHLAAKPRLEPLPANHPTKASPRQAERSSELGGRMRDREDTRRVDVACDYCEASGVYGGKPCPMCDGEGSRSLKRSSDLAEAIIDAGDRGRSPPTLPQGAAKSTKALAAQIIAAGKARRGL